MMYYQTLSSVSPSARFIHLSEMELTLQLKDAVLREKTATLQVVEYLSEMERRKLYAVQSYSSLFEYMVKELGYSETQACERINSMRLLNDIPEVKDLLENGDLSITTASQIQRFIRNEKRFSNEALTEVEKKKVIHLCAKKSKREVEKILFSLQSDEAKEVTSERVKRVGELYTELKFLVTDDVLANLDEVRNLVGESPLSTIFANSLLGYLAELRKKQAKDETLPQDSEKQSKKVAFPAKLPIRTTSFSSKSRYVPRTIKRMLYARSRGQCEYVDSESKNRCLSRFRIQIDHIVPFALGGRTEIENLRHLCPNHNRRSAVEWFC